MNSVNSVPCTGDDNCPFCKMFGQPTEKKMMFNVIDANGKTQIMTMNESKFKELFEKTMPEGKCWHVKVWKFEVIFWWMWRKLSWRDKRSGNTAEFRFWMFGPWEFRRY